ncbi:hypothetical protein J1614_004069 [Plenodomus biglobosus]|nr:hypothetical protein J1614_004069 [Plenodomus biglobosus]
MSDLLRGSSHYIKPSKLQTPNSILPSLAHNFFDQQAQPKIKTPKNQNQSILSHFRSAEMAGLMPTTEYSLPASRGLTYRVPVSVKNLLVKIIKQLPSTARSVYREHYRAIMATRPDAATSAKSMGDFVRDSFPEIFQDHDRLARVMNWEIVNKYALDPSPVLFPVIANYEADTDMTDEDEDEDRIGQLCEDRTDGQNENCNKAKQMLDMDDEDETLEDLLMDLEQDPEADLGEDNTRARMSGEDEPTSSRVSTVVNQQTHDPLGQAGAALGANATSPENLAVPGNPPVLNNDTETPMDLEPAVGNSPVVEDETMEDGTLMTEQEQSVENVSKTDNHDVQMSEQATADKTSSDSAMSGTSAPTKYGYPGNEAIAGTSQDLLNVDINEWAEKGSRWKPGHGSTSVYFEGAPDL